MLVQPEGFDRNRLICIQPWNDTAVRQWCEDASLGVPDNQTRKKIKSITGYWPLLLRKLVAKCNTGLLNPENLKDMPDDIFLKKPGQAELLRAFGLDNEGCRKVLDVLVDRNSGVVSDEELSTIKGDDGMPLSPELVSRALIWADTLNIASRSQGKWHLDSFVLRLLEGELLEKMA
jgi:hypothetical protein